MLRVLGDLYWTMLYGYVLIYSSVLHSVPVPLFLFFIFIFRPLGPVIIRSHISVTPPPTTQHSRNLSRTLELSVETTRTGYTPTWHALRSGLGSCLDGPFRLFSVPFMCDTIDYSLIYETHHLIASYPYHIPLPLFHRVYPTHTLLLLLQRHVRLLIQCFSFFFVG